MRSPQHRAGGTENDYSFTASRKQDLASLQVPRIEILETHFAKHDALLFLAANSR